jgi:putative chitinase|nr:MAG TPA: Chitinase A [Caudoviricetes sp.]
MDERFERENYLLQFLQDKQYPPIAIAVLMAQAKLETDRFKTMREYGNAAYFSRYDGRKDLGNVKPGDGARFRGRGYIQITGRNNYDKVGKFLNIDLLTFPELAEQPDVAVQIFDWFIHFGNRFKDGRNVLDCAKEGDIVGASKLVNGGVNGLKERKQYFAEYKEKLGVDGAGF